MSSKFPYLGEAHSPLAQRYKKEGYMCASSQESTSKVKTLQNHQDLYNFCLLRKLCDVFLGMSNLIHESGYWHFQENVLRNAHPQVEKAKLFRYEQKNPATSGQLEKFTTIYV